MKTVRETQKKYCSRAMMVSIFICLGFLLLGQKALGKGLVLGTIFSVVNFVLMGESLPMRIGKEKGRTFLVSLGSILIRYVLLAIPVIIAVKFETINLFTVVAGLFTVQIMIITEHVIKIFPNRRGQQI